MTSRFITAFAAFLLLLISFTGGYYAKTCPACPVCIQHEPVTVRQEQAAPALVAQAKAASREAELQQQITALQTEAAKRPATRTVTVVKEVPTECVQHVQRQAAADAAACLEAPDIDLINRARRATLEQTP